MPIHHTDTSWVLETTTTAYALGLNAGGLLTHRYWGPRLPFVDDYPPPPAPKAWASFDSAAHRTPEEYPGYGDLKYIEPCVKLTYADGVRVIFWQFVDAIVSGEELTITLRDAHGPLEVALHYQVFVAHDMIARWAVLSNRGDAPFELNRAFSAQWHLPPGEKYQLTHLAGRWFEEFRLHQAPLTSGVTVLESRRITTSHRHAPWFALDSGNADEDRGGVWFGTLAWSGNWKIAAERTEFGSTYLAIGLNDWDFALRLDADQSLTTPLALGGYTNEGFGGASRRLHDYVRAHVVPHPELTHKVLYNSWEATTFAVDEPSQVALAEIAAELGVELFVMDDGWFKGRVSDTAGLGDWTPDSTKFPNGLQPLIDHVNALGMEFGLWIEPEMVNPNSDLYRAHPEWALHFPGRPRIEARNQLILNLALPEVQDYLIATLDTLLRENKIAFIKWDMNRNVSEPGFLADDPQSLWLRYVAGLYHVWGTLRARHPSVIWQSCSGGGGRADYGILRFADQFWASDNTLPPMRLHIQHGASQLFPASTVEAWVTDMGARAFRYPSASMSVCAVSWASVRTLSAGARPNGPRRLNWWHSTRRSAILCMVATSIACARPRRMHFLQCNT
ncbi:alpha-galactosidase [Candidatus Gracilibacteria bacterium]|nr:alpha-galactosidase [Candidatus Gracilibacteria bacterium]